MKYKNGLKVGIIKKIFDTKKLLLILIFIFVFQSWTKSDDISEFQIEGISIGDSALDFYSKKEIKKFMKDYYPKSKKFYLMENDISKFQQYDTVQFAFKKKDKKFIIYGLSGGIWFENNINECLNKMSEIEKDLDIIFTNAVKKKFGEAKLQADESGESLQLGQSQYYLANGGVVSIDCNDYSKKLTKKYGYTDHLSITIYSKEYADFVMNEAY